MLHVIEEYDYLFLENTDMVKRDDIIRHITTAYKERTGYEIEIFGVDDDKLKSF